jgi:hypothetical protein
MSAPAPSVSKRRRGGPKLGPKLASGGRRPSCSGGCSRGEVARFWLVQAVCRNVRRCSSYKSHSVLFATAKQRGYRWKLFQQTPLGFCERAHPLSRATTGVGLGRDPSSPLNGLDARGQVENPHRSFLVGHSCSSQRRRRPSCSGLSGSSVITSGSPSGPMLSRTSTRPTPGTVRRRPPWPLLGPRAQAGPNARATSVPRRALQHGRRVVAQRHQVRRGGGPAEMAPPKP